jgi:hypothetical protein
LKLTASLVVWEEEGIYRLSGSSSEVASLKTRFEEGTAIIDGEIVYLTH